MKYFITGYKGFIGSHLVGLLNKEEEEWEGYDLVDGDDILDYEKLVKRMDGSDVVIHLAAQTSVPESWDSPGKYYLHNVVGTFNVIQAAKFNKIKKIVYAASSSALHPTSSPYALTKYVNELQLETHFNEVKAVATQFYNVYGTEQNKEYAAVIPAFYEGLSKKKTVIIYGDGKQTRDFTYVTDVCEAVYRFAKNFEPDIFRIVPIGRGKAVSINDLAITLAGIMGISDMIIDRREARAEVKHSCADPSLLKQLINFEPKVTLLEGLKDYVSYYESKTRLSL